MAAKKLGLREKYSKMTRDLSWDPTYQSMDKIYPQMNLEGLKIEDWDKWEDPFRLTMDAYWKYQAEKERKLYSIIEAFAQNNGQLNVTDARYVNALKLFLNGVSPLEYAAHRGFAMMGRQFPGVGAQVACQMQSVDELRHVQTQVHTISHYNKYFNGLDDFRHKHDNVWYLSVPKSFFDDAMTAGPFEFITAISFSFEYVLTNLLFMPFMSGAAYNGDMATVTFGFSAQSDEARHMTLGLEVIKFMLEQHPDNVPIVQRWIDKWFWRGYRLLSLVAMMMDYMLPKKVMSWKEAWEMYFVQNGGALFEDLARYGIRMPKYWEETVKGMDHLSHQTWNTFYTHNHAAAFHTWMPDQEEQEWLSAKYPESFDKYYRPRWDFYTKLEEEGKPFGNPSLPMLCQTCQIPMFYTEADDPTTVSYRVSEHKGNKYHTCSDGCKDIFDHEPEKYIQAWLPVHQIFQGNCGGASLDDVLDWYRMDKGVENVHYRFSADYANWKKWKGLDDEPAADDAAEIQQAASA